MKSGLTVIVVDPDEDYLGIEIVASSARFSGSTRIFAGLTELGECATSIEGFPVNKQEVRTIEFGNRAPGFAGGYCRLHFHTIDLAGHIAIGIEIIDDHQDYQKADARFSIRVSPAAIDLFAQELRRIEKQQSGECILPELV